MNFVRDVFERTVGTYVSVFLGLITAAGFDLMDMGALKAASIAALPAALTVLKGLLGTLVGDPATAAWLPERGSAHRADRHADRA